MTDKAFLRAIFRGECFCPACIKAKEIGMNTISLGPVSAILSARRLT